MPGIVDEATGNQGQMSAALAAGLDTLDLNYTVTWNLYQRMVLPLDGFVFWVNARLLNSSEVQGQLTFDAKGSLHHTTTNRQDADESFSVNRMIFTTNQRVNDLAEIAPDSLYLATTNGQRFAFSSRSMWYKQADLYHYSGDAVYPALATQIIDEPSQLNRELVVSNSLPLWLTFNQQFPVYPSFLVPDNIRPPYASVHIGEDDTSPMQAGAFHDSIGSRWQLAKDTVRVTFYGVRNDAIMDWLDAVTAYTLNNPGVLGVMNTPVPRDAKRGQTEISAIAQKKVVVFEADYYQKRIRDASRQLITKALLEDFLVPAA